MCAKLLAVLMKPRSESRTENLTSKLFNLLRSCNSVGPFPQIISNYHQTIGSLKFETIDAAASMETDDIDNALMWTPLAMAVQGNKIQDVRRLLLQGVELDALLPGGRTAFLLAAELCMNEICKMLLLGGANPSSIDPRGYTALHFAVESSHLNLTAELLSMLCMMVPINAMTNEGKTALSLAVAKKLFEVAKTLIAKGAKIDVLDNCGKTLLHVAAENGSCQIFLLLDFPALRKMSSTASLDTVMMPMHIAAKNGHTEFVRYLVGKDLFVMDAKDREGRSALHLATAEGHWEVVESLLDGNWNIADSMSVTRRKCLHLVSANGAIDGVKLFLRRGADPNVLDSQFWTPLHYAVYGNHLEVIKVLLEAGANMHLKNIDQKTPAMLAQRDSGREIVDIFSNGCSDQADGPAEPPMMDVMDTTEAVDWGDLQLRNRKRYLVHSHLDNLDMKLALHRYFTYPADYDTRAGMNRRDLAHSGFFFSVDYQSLQCFYCTFEIKSLDGWKGLDLDELNKRHADKSSAEFG